MMCLAADKLGIQRPASCQNVRRHAPTECATRWMRMVSLMHAARICSARACCHPRLLRLG